MAILEPATVETCTATFILACREALEECIKRGVPEQAARDFVMGHINIQLALIFDQLKWRMSDGALLMLKDGMNRLLKPDWKEVFNTDDVKRQVLKIVEPVSK